MISRCEVCGNDYDKTFQIVGPSGTHTFARDGIFTARGGATAATAIGR